MGRVHSIQSLGAVDGPGIRFVVFLQGCNLRCGCCHNPDTWDGCGGTEFSAEEIVEKAVRYREYFGKDGGITLSGGEPLLQAGFVCKIFKKCRAQGINTCLDTSGSVLNQEVKEALEYTDRVLLDVKYTNDELYRKYVGCGIDKVVGFLEYLDERGISTTLRQVVIPTLNDNEQNFLALKAMAQKYACVDKTELLPFRKLCIAKYQNMGIDFPFADIPEPIEEDMLLFQKLIS